MTDIIEKAKQYNRELRDGLQTIFNELNKGQTKKILKNETVAKLVEKHKIQHK